MSPIPTLMTATRIGITTSYVQEKQSLHRSYVQSVQSAGALPLLLPVVETEREARELVGTIDGLIISGGPGITEGLIGTLPPELEEADPDRVRSDRLIARAVLDSGKPVLGICYGMQLLNVMAGGTLFADVERQLEEAYAHSNRRDATNHPVWIMPESHLADILKKVRVDVNTAHFQAVAKVGQGYRVAATETDGAIEAIENAAGTVIGVQWHPERMGSSMRCLFEHLVSSARQFATAQAVMAGGF